jgi:multimeric flavodoxin WrbA
MSKQKREYIMILGFNGSPKPDSNLRRIIDMMLKESGKDYRIYDLAQMNIKPCVGCVKCAKNNRCVMEDDMFPLYDEIVESDAIVVGAVVYFRKANGFTHNFLERFFPLRHKKPQTMGKPAVSVAVGGNEAEIVCDEISYHLSSYFNFEILDKLFYNTMTPPCFICGFGTTCKYGGPARWMSPEEFDKFNKVTPDMFQKFETDNQIVKRVKEIGRQLGSI